MKYTEKNVPQSLQVRVQHSRKHPRYRWVTHCELIDRYSGRVTARATAHCAPQDNPSRKIGRAIAVGRALKSYFEDEPS